MTGPLLANGTPTVPSSQTTMARNPNNLPIYGFELNTKRSDKYVNFYKYQMILTTCIISCKSEHTSVDESG